MEQKKFAYKFEKEPANRITLDYSPLGDDKIDCTIENGIPFVYLNRPGMITLARTLIKIALGNHQEGFHVHFNKGFNADLPECLTILLSPDDAPPYE